MCEQVAGGLTGPRAHLEDRRRIGKKPEHVLEHCGRIVGPNLVVLVCCSVERQARIRPHSGRSDALVSFDDAEANWERLGPERCPHRGLDAEVAQS